MANNIKQYYDIKYPFTDNNPSGLFIDMNEKLEDKVASEILHTILTRKGTRIRMPNFGTDLTKYIFDMNDDVSWENVESEVKTAVNNYVPNASINSIKVVRATDDDNGVYLDLNYSVTKGVTTENNRLVVKL